MKNEGFRLYALLALLVLIPGACQKEGPTSLDELDVVATQYDKNFDFGSVKYYLMPDTVAVITDNPDYQKTDAELEHERTILDQVAARMDQNGFTRLTLADTANQALMNDAVILLVSRSTVSYDNYYYDYWYYGYDYWNWYGGMNYYNPGYSYNYYYPWGYPVSYSYTVGTVILEMVDPSNPVSVDTQQSSVDYPVRWMAVLNGILSGSLTDMDARITKSINQSFDQSPYL